MLEPTCGKGHFLSAAHRALGGELALWGMDIHPAHVAHARERLPHASLSVGDAFTEDWAARLEALPGPTLVLGNPPWVTTSVVGADGGRNRPAGDRAHGLSGMEAITGQGNFDLSEWVLWRMWAALSTRGGAVAFLLKTSVARRALQRAWQRGLPLRGAALFAVDARAHFGAAVDASLLVTLVEPGAAPAPRCHSYPDLSAATPVGAFALRDGLMVADEAAFDRISGYLRPEGAPLPEVGRWRSGVKHDCGAVFELTRHDGGWRNGLGEVVHLEEAVTWPLSKGSDVFHGRPPGARRLLITQRALGSDPATLAETAPAAWAYLNAHGARLDGRKSRIYRGRPRFAQFGIGAYTFAPFKVALSALHRPPRPRVVRPLSGRAVVFDDTVVFWATSDPGSAEKLSGFLLSARGEDFHAAFMFPGAKRALTVGVLNRLDLATILEG